MLALGIAPRTAAGILPGPLVPTTLVGHPSWKEKVEARATQEIQSTKNLAMRGGLLLAMAD